MEKEIVEVPVLSESLRKQGVPLSPAVKANGFVFVSGLPPLDTRTGELVKGDVDVQTRASLEAVKHALQSAGSSLEKVVKVTFYATNAAYFSRINAIYREYFPANPPARTFVTVGSWPFDFDVEVECVALA